MNFVSVLRREEATVYPGSHYPRPMTQTASQLSLEEPELQEGRDESSEEKKASSFSSAYAQQPHSKEIIWHFLAIRECTSNQKLGRPDKKSFICPKGQYLTPHRGGYCSLLFLTATPSSKSWAREGIF